MKILFEYEDGDFEMFDGDEKEAKYWFERRIEKSGKYVSKGYMFDAPLLDIASWKRAYEDQCERYEKQAQEEHDKREYERLKNKFGG